jgi:hypothetical protein
MVTGLSITAHKVRYPVTGKLRTCTIIVKSSAGAAKELHQAGDGGPFTGIAMPSIPA